MIIQIDHVVLATHSRVLREGKKVAGIIKVLGLW